jgi:hypothetical protein
MMKDKTYYLIVGLLLGVLIMTFVAYFIDRLSNQRYQLTLAKAELELHNVQMFCNNVSVLKAAQKSNKGNIVNGVANFDTGIATINMKDRNIIEVLDTCTHEYAHLNLGLVDP